MKRFESAARIGFVWVWELLGLVGAMSIPIANIFLSIPWGFLFARWAADGPPEGVGRRAWLLTLHSVVPCFALTLLPLVLWVGSMGQWNILDPLAAYEYFGTPVVLRLPFPFNTIFGLYWGMALVSVLLKILVTMLLTRLFLAAAIRKAGGE